MDDREAIARLKAGDPSGLEPLVRRYQVKALRTAFLITHDRALAEEAVQESFLRFYRAVKRFDATRPVASYLLRIVVRVALNIARREQRTTTLDNASLEQVEALLNQATRSVESQIAYNALVEEIEQALAALTPRQRAVIVQRYYLGMSEQEMAQRLTVTPGTIKRLLYNARRRLRHLLHDHEGRAK